MSSVQKIPAETNIQRSACFGRRRKCNLARVCLAEVTKPLLLSRTRFWTQVATIVRGADTSIGLSANFPDDQEMLRYGLVVYDALYASCRKTQATAAKPAAG